MVKQFGTNGQPMAATPYDSAEIEVSGPRNENHGKREGSITDPDGNLIRFGSPIR